MLWKKIIAFFLLIAVMTSSFSGLLVIADYYTNTGAYAKNCINKLKPYLHCNGKCQLMKKIEEQEKKEQQNTDSKMFLKSILISSKSFYAGSPVFLQPIVEREYIIPDMGNEIKHQADIFHPPLAC